MHSAGFEHRTSTSRVWCYTDWATWRPLHGNINIQQYKILPLSITFCTKIFLSLSPFDWLQHFFIFTQLWRFSYLTFHPPLYLCHFNQFDCFNIFNLAPHLSSSAVCFLFCNFIHHKKYLNLLLNKKIIAIVVLSWFSLFCRFWLKFMLRLSTVVHNESCTKILIFRFLLILQEDYLPNRLFQEAKCYFYFHENDIFVGMCHPFIFLSNLIIMKEIQMTVIR